MASLLVLFFFLLLLLVTLLLHASAVAGQGVSSEKNLISLGSSLSPSSPQHSSFWPSPSGLFAFGFYPQGSGFAVGVWLVGEPNNTVVWTANRDYPPVTSNASIELTGDGKLLLRTDHGRGGQETPLVGLKAPAAAASMLDSGDFVIYGNDFQVIWDTFGFPTDTILGGQNLSAPGELVASKSGSDRSSGRFLLLMQSDGNLVAYPANTSNFPGDAYWASQTYWTSDAFIASKLCLSPGSHLYVSLPKSAPVTLSNSSYSVGENETAVYRATLDADGIFRLYTHVYYYSSRTRRNRSSSVMRLEWSALQNQCEVRGFCGFNSFCSNTTGRNRADCICFPGFAYIDANDTNRGCYRNFSEKGLCGEREPAAQLYKVAVLDHMMWKAYPFFMSPTKDQESCRKSCLEDCNCEAALYKEGVCRKFKLPIRYGVASLGENATAFFKLASEAAAHLKNSTPAVPLVSLDILVDDKKTTILVLAISLGSVALLCFLVSVSIFLAYRRRVRRYRKLSSGSVALVKELTLRPYSYAELEKATDGFKEELGKGSSLGAVYRGSLSEGNKIVAVKKLEGVSEKGEREFGAEMMTMARTHHKNLVRLIGYCSESSRKLLVYEYMSNGSLSDLLFKAEEERPVWKERARIALEVARGILYLHEECEAHIIHCGIKPENILMDDSWTAKISDFGFAKLLVPNQSVTRASIMGTKGYLAPEWFQNAMISAKTDVYSYGVLLLEIVCCRGNMEVNVSSADEVLLSTWAYDCLVNGQLDKLVGGEEVDMRSLERMVKVGLLCIQDDPTRRPSMKNVILMLEGAVSIPVPPCSDP